MLEKIKAILLARVFGQAAKYVLKRALEWTTYAGVGVFLVATLGLEVSQDWTVELAKWIAQGVGLLLAALPNALLAKLGLPVAKQ